MPAANPIVEPISGPCGVEHVDDVTASLERSVLRLEDDEVILDQYPLCA